jgi:hypothetical protein
LVRAQRGKFIILQWNEAVSHRESSFIAVLLGLFGMTVEEAMQEFYSVYDSVFDVASHSPQQRAGILQAKIKSLMARNNLNIPESAKLEDIRFGGDCKV